MSIPSQASAVCFALSQSWQGLYGSTALSICRRFSHDEQGFTLPPVNALIAFATVSPSPVDVAMGQSILAARFDTASLPTPNDRTGKWPLPLPFGPSPLNPLRPRVRRLRADPDDWALGTGPMPEDSRRNLSYPLTASPRRV